MTILLILIIIMSIRHAFEPDHIAAVLTISSQSHSLTSVAKQGAIWGIGHSITLFIFSVILVGLQIEINESVFIILECLFGSFGHDLHEVKFMHVIKQRLDFLHAHFRLRRFHLDPAKPSFLGGYAVQFIKRFEIRLGDILPNIHHGEFAPQE